MKPTIDLISGEWVKLPSAEDREKVRLSRMRHIIWLAVVTMQRMQGEDGTRLLMYTLTYKGLGDWTPLHISGFCRWLRRNGHTAYMWVGELQKRGAVHYHVLASLPIGVQWVKPNDGHGWAHGFTWVTDEIRRPLYIMKYLQKGSQNGHAIRFPKHFRLYAVSQRIVHRMDYENSLAYRKSQLPGWARNATCPSWDMRSTYRVRGGVAFGRFTAYSPYTQHGLESVDAVGEKMYTSFARSPILTGC